MVRIKYLTGSEEHDQIILTDVLDGMGVSRRNINHAELTAGNWIFDVPCPLSSVLCPFLASSL